MLPIKAGHTLRSVRRFLLGSGSALAATHTPSLSTPVRSTAIQGHETKRTQAVFKGAKTGSPASSPPSCSQTSQLYASHVKRAGTERRCSGTERRCSCEAGRMSQARPPRSVSHRGSPHLVVHASVSSAHSRATKAGLGARTGTAMRGST